jgi:hypothetical protein
MSAMSVHDALDGPALLPPASALADTGRQRALVTLAVFALYWLSAIILQARNGTTHFGADAHLYSLLADGTAVDRITRFHPLTTAMAALWMKAMSPLTAWLTPHQILKGMFAAAGAAGVWGAMAAFAEVSPRRLVPWLGIIYALSLGVWYFSSIEESKIVTTTLAAFYIATYLRLRTRWSTRGAVQLTVILLLACVNEIVAAFLVALPAVDSLVRYGWNLRCSRWIAVHALAAPAALLFLEGVVNGHLVAAGTDPEGASHISMLIYYFTRNDFSLNGIYAFAIRWLFFNIAAPGLFANDGFDPEEHYAGDFEPALSGYLASPVSVALVGLLAAILAVILLPRYRGASLYGMRGVLLGLLAYASLRCAFFYLVEADECLLFSSGVTLPHMLIVAMPFVASRFPWKQPLLICFAALLFIVNATFIVGQ